VSPNLLRIATRESPLALWQAEWVGSELRRLHPGLEVELVSMSTSADRDLSRPLAEIGGKGVFAKEIQLAVLEGRADIAVHSAKDLPARSHEGLELVAAPERADCRDALVGAELSELKAGDVVATGSNRRRVLLAELVPGLVFSDLRGNMATRLSKSGDFAAILVAAVALERLGLSGKISEILDPELFTPQVGQGTLAVEARTDDAFTKDLLAPLNHAESLRELSAERSFLDELGGDCDLPAGAWATTSEGGTLRLRAVLAASAPAAGVPATAEHLPARVEESGEDPVAIGAAAARKLLDLLGVR
jgi:hydroxymethylbilane synthase